MKNNKLFIYGESKNRHPTHRIRYFLYVLMFAFLCHVFRNYIEIMDSMCYHFQYVTWMGGVHMSLLKDTLMDALELLKPKSAVVLANEMVYASGCGCTGSCGQSCSGGCEAGCTGSCGRSCSGGCS